MKKSSILILVLIALLLFFLRPRTVASIVTDGVDNSEVEIISIKKYNNGSMAEFDTNLYDLDEISDVVKQMSVMPYPWGREINYDFDKPYILIDLLVNGEDVTIDVVGNQIGIRDKNYWVYSKEMLAFDIEEYLK